MKITFKEEVIDDYIAKIGDIVVAHDSTTFLLVKAADDNTDIALINLDKNEICDFWDDYFVFKVGSEFASTKNYVVKKIIRAEKANLLFD